MDSSVEIALLLGITLFAIISLVTSFSSSSRVIEEALDAVYETEEIKIEAVNFDL